ncbi:MAG: GMC family oxidoreductase [Chloroflexi bacterium]|nr:GMC family oxidoreductase [Chloroflexota bacterium]
MLSDGRELGGSVRDADVCVAGAGPAGITLARELAGRGLRVCLLESGGARWSIRNQLHFRGKNRGLPYFPLARARTRAFGGTSHHWLKPKRGWSVDGGLRCRPLDALDFAERPHVPGSGWPFDAATLRPFYERAHIAAGIPDPVYDPARLSDPGSTPLLDLPGGVVETVACLMAPSTAFLDCFAELRDAPNVDLILNATAVGFDAEGGPLRVRSLQVAGTGGARFSVRAKHFVLAGGGIENARLLLNARIGNEHGLVGRTFTEHVQLDSGVLHPAGPGLLDRLGFYRRHQAGGNVVLGALRLSDRVIAEEGLLNSVTTFLPREPLFTSPGVRSFAELFEGARMGRGTGHVRGHAATVARGFPDVARAITRRALHRGSRGQPVLSLVTTAEQAPNPRSRVTLDRARDAFGLRRARLDWRLGELDYRSLRRTQELLAGQFAAAGLGQLTDLWGDTSPPPTPVGCWHHIGTTRMHANPGEGVVDPDCRVHSTENLFVAGSSVMPTAGATTVTLTLVALAIRLADHLAGLSGAP